VRTVHCTLCPAQCVHTVCTTHCELHTVGTAQQAALHSTTLHCGLCSMPENKSYIGRPRKPELRLALKLLGTALHCTAVQCLALATRSGDLAGDIICQPRSTEHKIQCTALHCTAQCTALQAALHCTALHYTVLHCTVLQSAQWAGLEDKIAPIGPGKRLESTALHCTALHCTALHCTALHCTARCCPIAPPSLTPW